MALDVAAEVEIARNRGDVAVFAFEPSNDPKWIGGISEAHLLTERPVGQGTQVRRLAKFLGKTIDYILEVTSFEAGGLMVMESVKGPFPMHVTYTLDDAGPSRTRARIRVQGTASKHYGITDWLMAFMVKRNISRDLRKLKAILEDQSSR